MEVQFHQLDLKFALLGRPQTPPRLTQGRTQPWGAWDACLPPGPLHTRPQAWAEKSWPHWMPGPSRALPGKEGVMVLSTSRDQTRADQPLPSSRLARSQREPASVKAAHGSVFSPGLGPESLQDRTMNLRGEALGLGKLL